MMLPDRLESPVQKMSCCAEPIWNHCSMFTGPFTRCHNKINRKTKIRQASGLGPVRSRAQLFPLLFIVYCLLFMGLPPLSPIEDIWGRNLKHQKVSCAHPDPNYGPGVVTDIDAIGGASHRIPLNFISESNNDVHIFMWEAKCDQNTASVLVLEAPHNIKNNDLLMISGEDVWCLGSLQQRNFWG